MPMGRAPSPAEHRRRVPAGRRAGRATHRGRNVRVGVGRGVLAGVRLFLDGVEVQARGAGGQQLLGVEPRADLVLGELARGPHPLLGDRPVAEGVDLDLHAVAVGVGVVHRHRHAVVEAHERQDALGRAAARSCRATGRRCRTRRPCGAGRRSCGLFTGAVHPGQAKQRDAVVGLVVGQPRRVSRRSSTGCRPQTSSYQRTIASTPAS